MLAAKEAMMFGSNAVDVCRKATTVSVHLPADKKVCIVGTHILCSYLCRLSEGREFPRNGTVGSTNIVGCTFQPCF